LINAPLITFNGGEISERLSARVDYGKYPASSALMENWRPSIEGSMVSRPGTIFEGQTLNNRRPYYGRFVFSLGQSFILEFTDQKMRILSTGGAIQTSNSSATISNGEFADATDWNPVTGGSSTITFGSGAIFSGDGGEASTISQSLTTVVGQPVSISVDVDHGPVDMRFGSFSTSLGTGTHVIEVTPTATSTFLEFEVLGYGYRKINSAAVMSGGDLVFDTPYRQVDFRRLRLTQTLDVVYISNLFAPEFKIERRSNQSWSLVRVDWSNGPFEPINVSDTTLALSGERNLQTLTSSRDLFNSGHIGSLWRLIYPGQVVNQAVSGDDQFTSSVRVSGITTERSYSVTVSGTFNGTITIQRSIGVEGNWIDVNSFSGPGTLSITDPDDNSIVFIRAGFKAGEFVSGTADVLINYAQGTTETNVRVISFTDERNMRVEVLDFAPTTEPVTQWSEGTLSASRSYSSALDFFEGRLWLGVNDEVISSVSNDVENFESGTDADRSVRRNIFTSFGGIIQWLKGADRVLVGTSMAEGVVRSTSFDEPITPTTATAKSPTQTGSGDVEALKIGSSVLFASQSRRRLWRLSTGDNVSYQTDMLNRLHLEIFGKGITKMAFAQEPYRRVYCVIEDGDMIVCTYHPDDDILAFSRETTNGTFITVEVIPQEDEDEVWVGVARRIGNQTVFMNERFEKEELTDNIEDTVGVDSSVVWSGECTKIIRVPHLEGECVSILANGKSHECIVRDGNVELPREADKAIIGLPYNSDWKSLRLAYGARQGTALTQPKKVSQVGFIVRRCGQGLSFGPGPAKLEEVARFMADGDMDITEGYIEGEGRITIDQGFNTDARLYCRNQSPWRAEILAMIPHVSTHEFP